MPSENPALGAAPALWLSVQSPSGKTSWWHLGARVMEEANTAPPPGALSVSLSSEDIRLSAPRALSSREARRALRRHAGGAVETINASARAGVIYGRRRQAASSRLRVIPAGLLVEVLLQTRGTGMRPCITGLQLSGALGPQQILALWSADGQGNLTDLQFTDNAERQAPQIIADYCHRHGVDPMAPERRFLFTESDVLALTSTRGHSLAYPDQNSWAGIDRLALNKAVAWSSLALLIALAGNSLVQIGEGVQLGEAHQSDQAAIAAIDEEINHLLLANLPLVAHKTSIDVSRLIEAADQAHPGGTRVVIRAMTHHPRLEVHSIGADLDTSSPFLATIGSAIDLPAPTAMPRLFGGLPQRIEKEGSKDAHLEYTLPSIDRGLPRGVLLERSRG